MEKELMTEREESEDVINDSRAIVTGSLESRRRRKLSEHGWCR